MCGRALLAVSKIAAVIFHVVKTLENHVGDSCVLIIDLHNVKLDKKMKKNCQEAVSALCFFLPSE